MDKVIDGLLAQARLLDSQGFSADRERYIAELSFKAGIKKAIKVYTPYVKALEEENGSLTGFASTHGWSSSQVEFGKKCRDRIKKLKAICKPN